MPLEITSLSTRYRVTPQGNLWDQDIPFIAVIATFRIKNDEHLFERTKEECQEYRETLTIDDPKKYEKFLLNWDFNYSSKYDGYGRAWIHNESPFIYIDKFSTFWFRDYVADSTVTRAIIRELEYYRDYGKLPSVYRHAEEYVVLSLFHMLDRLWD